ncbi:MAG: hypothetical protein JSV71_00030 [Nitrospiraceae bacterium]|nr:MAG: hypothetical protein JSV71_00030 [Nitrospiraceae bacterium]
MGKLTQGVLTVNGVHEQGIQAKVTQDLYIGVDFQDDKIGNNIIYLKPERIWFFFVKYMIMLK